jgi:AcrR family transcriptional regulator
MNAGTQKQAGNTREQILDAAHDFFIRQGYHGTSMRQIAEAAQIALGGIYNHFPSKEALFETVFLQNHPYHDVLPVLVQTEGKTPEALVRDAAGRMLQALAKRPNFIKLMFVEIVEFQSVHISELFKQIIPQGTKMIRKFVEGQNHTRPIPPEILLRTFLGLFISYYITEVILSASPHPHFDEETMEHFVQIYLHGILREA